MKATYLPSKYQRVEIGVLATSGKTMDPIVVQRLETVAILIAAIGLYVNLDSSWLLFGTVIFYSIYQSPPTILTINSDRLYTICFTAT